MPSEKQRLTQMVKDKRKQMELERERQKPSPNQKMAEGALDFVEYDFWCDACMVDFSAMAHKTVHRLYGDHIAVYRAIHEDCGTECIRHITHRDHDLYYQVSDKINRQRNEYADDVLQAEQYGFRSNFGEPWEEYNNRLKEKEEKIIKGEMDKGFRGLSFEAQERIRRLHA